MAIPQSVTDALNKLDGDAATTATALANQATAEQALADAQHTKDTADAAVTAAQSQEAADLQAALTLIQSTYGPTVPPPGPTTPGPTTPGPQAKCPQARS